MLTEGFETVPALFAGGGWAQQNLSNPPGAGIWTQGSAASGLGAAQAGTTNSFMVVNFTSGTGTSNLSNWAFMPTLALNNGDVLSFYTRTAAGSPFPDRLQVRMSTNGASVNVGANDTTVGDFTNLLLDINPTLAVGGYPNAAWTQFNVTISGLGGPTSGRIAFRYFVTNGGPSGANSNIIGIDSLTYTSITCPTPTPTPTATPTPTSSANSDTYANPNAYTYSNTGLRGHVRQQRVDHDPGWRAWHLARTCGDPYPANIAVSGLSGTVLKVTLKLNGLTHTFPSDIDVLLVGPGGQNAIVMSDVGDGNAVDGRDPHARRRRGHEHDLGDAGHRDVQAEQHRGRRTRT